MRDVSKESVMRVTRATMLLTVLLAFSATAGAASKDEQRAAIRKGAADTLAELHESTPSAEKLVESAAGHAVFSNFGMKIPVAGGGAGKGIVVDNKSKEETFMKMAELQAGLGFGVKKFRLVWVFGDKADLDRFVNSGWELGAQTTVAAQYQGEGDAFEGAVAIKPGVWLYQLTGDGLALELTARGTRYYRDDELN